MTEKTMMSGAQDRERDQGDTRPQPDQRQVQDQEHHVADVHAGDDRPDELGVLLEEHRAGLQAVHHQTAQQHGHGRRRSAARTTKRGTNPAAGRWRCWPPRARPPPRWPPCRSARDAWRHASRRRRRRRSSPTGAHPGRSPRKKPTTVERSMAPVQRLMSAHVGIQVRILASRRWLRPTLLDVDHDLADGKEPDDDADEVDRRP